MDGRVEIDDVEDSWGRYAEEVLGREDDVNDVDDGLDGLKEHLSAVISHQGVCSKKLIVVESIIFGLLLISIVLCHNIIIIFL